MNKPLLTIGIPIRNEFPSVTHTVHSILNSLETDNIQPKDVEIILADNCSTDRKTEKGHRGTGGSIDYLRTRGMYWNRVLRTMYYPLAGNHTVRNRIAEMARGKYIFFSDAHMSYCPHYFSEFMRTVDESDGIVHGVLDWIGAYPPSKGGLGYTIKLGDDIRGTWNGYRIRDREGNIVEDWLYVPALGHCSLGMLREQFLDFGGYQEHHRCYGGGEFYLNMKWWMFGKTCAVNPKMVGYHLSSGRGYSYNHDDYKYNVFQIGYALGMDEWVERAYLNWLRSGRKEVLDKKLKEAWDNSQKDREFINSRKVKSFNDVLLERPWEKLNIEKWGHGLPQLQLFHNSWIDLMKTAPDYCKEAYRKSELQPKLDKFIREKLWAYVYKHEKYSKDLPVEL